MFQILSALVLDVPAAEKCLTNICGVSPNVLLAFEPWGHVDHASGECPCRSSDRTSCKFIIPQVAVNRRRCSRIRTQPTVGCVTGQEDTQ